MKRIDIFISRRVDSKVEAAAIVAEISDKLKEQADITVRAEYQDRETITNTKTKS